MNQMHPIGRYGVTEDIANAIEFLASDKSSWITGENMKVLHFFFFLIFDQYAKPMLSG